ncbi:MAG: nuclear transport factor 2 family protein [Acidobacteria bacterium]|nr:nuclear transport factor 2 family protein [Acidobacteriota bacterium]
MKRILFATLFILIAVAPNFGQAASKSAKADGKVEQEIFKALDEVLTALVKRDGAVIERLFTDDYFTVYDGGQVGDRARLIESLKSTTNGWDDWQRVESKVNFHSNTAIVLCRYQVKFHNSTGSHEALWRSTGVWVKEGGQWRLAASQFTVIKPPPPKPQ